MRVNKTKMNAHYVYGATLWMEKWKINVISLYGSSDRSNTKNQKRKMWLSFTMKNNTKIKLISQIEKQWSRRCCSDYIIIPLYIQLFLFPGNHNNLFFFLFLFSSNKSSKTILITRLISVKQSMNNDGFWIYWSSLW